MGLIRGGKLNERLLERPRLEKGLGKRWKGCRRGQPRRKPGALKITPVCAPRLFLASHADSAHRSRSLTSLAWRSPGLPASTAPGDPQPGQSAAGASAPAPVHSRALPLTAPPPAALVRGSWGGGSREGFGAKTRMQASQTFHFEELMQASQTFHFEELDRPQHWWEPPSRPQVAGTPAEAGLSPPPLPGGATFLWLWIAASCAPAPPHPCYFLTVPG